jgi:hypothetical protein
MKAVVNGGLLAAVGASILEKLNLGEAQAQEVF